MLKRFFAPNNYHNIFLITERTFASVLCSVDCLAGSRKRECIAALQKQPIIIAIETISSLIKRNSNCVGQHGELNTPIIRAITT